MYVMSIHFNYVYNGIFLIDFSNYVRKSLVVFYVKIKVVILFF